MTGLLREKLGYDGLIQTDWGLKHLDAALAGADVLRRWHQEIQRLAGGLPGTLMKKCGSWKRSSSLVCLKTPMLTRLRRRIRG